MAARMFSRSSRPSLASEAPIGIFDSGIGGLTVAHAIAQALPAERMLYFGDTAHMPYGDRSAELVRSYSVRIAEFLVEQGCKAVVIACNSASATAKSAVEKALGSDVPVIDVVAPVVRHLAEREVKRVGIVGTRATIGSGIYGTSLEAAYAERRLEGHKIEEWATPLLAPLIEEGWQDHALMDPVIGSYLDAAGWRAKGVVSLDAMVLGCTHYPLAQSAFRRAVGPNVELVDGPNIVAQAVGGILGARGLLGAGSPVDIAGHGFIVSDLTENFVRSARRFFGESIPLKAGGPWAIV